MNKQLHNVPPHWPRRVAELLLPAGLTACERRAVTGGLAALFKARGAGEVSFSPDGLWCTLNVYGRRIHLHRLNRQARLEGEPLSWGELEQALAGHWVESARVKRSAEAQRVVRRAPLGGTTPGGVAPSAVVREEPGVGSAEPRVGSAGRRPSPRDVAVFDRDGRRLRSTTRMKAENRVHAGRAEWMGPAAIRLTRSPLADALVKARVRERDRGLCHYCGKPTHDTTLLVPRAAGGTLTLSNCVCCCRACAAAHTTSTS